jgi:hypothetical protein
VCEQLLRVIRPDVGAPVDGSMQVRGQRQRDGTVWVHIVGQLPVCQFFNSFAAPGCRPYICAPYFCPAPAYLPACLLQALVKPLYDCVMQRMAAQVRT